MNIQQAARVYTVVFRRNITAQQLLNLKNMRRVVVEWHQYEAYSLNCWKLALR